MSDTDYGASRPSINAVRSSQAIWTISSRITFFWSNFISEGSRRFTMVLTPLALETQRLLVRLFGAIEILQVGDVLRRTPSGWSDDIIRADARDRCRQPDVYYDGYSPDTFDLRNEMRPTTRGFYATLLNMGGQAGFST